MCDSRLERFGFDRLITITVPLSTKDQCQMYCARAVCGCVWGVGERGGGGGGGLGINLIL